MQPRFQCHLAVIVLLAIVAPVHADSDIDRVNQQRRQAGLGLLLPDEALSLAAQRHADYLDRHREPGKTPAGMTAHGQRPEDAGFSGETPAVRAVAAGYPHREVLENVSMGYPDGDSAMSGLMSAIYHRLTFLDLEADQLGVAAGERSHVFLLGRSDIAELCRAQPAAALHRTPVDCLGTAMTRGYYEDLCANLPADALFRSSHPIACPNGVRLDADFMATLCERPPREAVFGGHGRYFMPCGNDTRLNADWFNALCETPPDAARYRPSGHYYEICEGPTQVYSEWFEAQCANLPESARYTDSGRFRRPCARAVDVRVEYLGQLDEVRQSVLPEVVLWPPDGARDVVPAFFIEEPDPLPDLDVSGYPLSIQFNPARAQAVELTAFRLFRVVGDTLVTVEPVRLLHSGNDPNHLLSDHEFALFPLTRLVWGAHYHAQVEARVDGVTRRFDWSFSTLGLGMPLLTAEHTQQRFTVRNGVDYLLFLPPLADTPYTVLGTRTEHLRGNRVTLEVVDPNTLQLRVDARYCEVIGVAFDSGRQVELIPQGCPQ